MAQFVKKDPQNPYRTGVLIGNYCEDKFGVELSEKPVSIISENAFNIGLQICSLTYLSFHFMLNVLTRN